MKFRLSKVIKVISLITLMAMINVLIKLNQPLSHPLVQNSPVPSKDSIYLRVIPTVISKTSNSRPPLSPQIPIVSLDGQLKGKALSYFDIRKKYPYLNGSQLVSYPLHPNRFPMSLKKVDPDQWLPKDKKWLNVSHHLWLRPEHCVNHSVKFGPPHSLPVMGLASFPSSGNSWVRYLIEGATGIFTGSMYQDIVLARTGMYGELVPFNSGMTIVQKTHGFTTKLYNTSDELQIDITKNHLREMNCSGIILIRDPFKAIVSHRHLDVGGHKGFAPPQHFTGEGWDSFVQTKSSFWESFYTFWIKSCSKHNIYILNFEELEANPMAGVKRILNFLNVTPDSSRLACLENNIEGRMKRRTPRKTGRDYFLTSQKEMVFLSIYNLNHLLEKSGLPTLPISSYQYNEEYKLFLQNMNVL